MFGQARQQIRDLTRENKKQCAQLKQVRGDEFKATGMDIQHSLRETEIKNYKL